jgi:hypothetical protein
MDERAGAAGLETGAPETLAGVAPFSLEEAMRLLGEASVSAAGLAGVGAIRCGSLAPLVELSASTGRTREIALGVSLQGLGPRLAALPRDRRLPAELRGHLDAEAERGQARGERVLGLLADLAALFAGEGLRAVPLKGAALVLGGEVPAGLRPMADLDLLFASEGDLGRAAGRIEAELGWRPLWNTDRHLVLAERDERVVLPGCEHPGNPLRIELHRAFRLGVLGRTLDATDALRRGTRRAGAWELPSEEALLLHLLLHAAEDFAAKGLRGVQCVDFLLLARRLGPLPLEGVPARALSPVVLAARAIEGLFPGTFAPEALERASSEVAPRVLLRAATVPALRHSRAARGWTRTALGLVDGAVPATRFVLRTLFPPLDEVKANVAPGAAGPALAAAWLRVLSGRAGSAVRGLLGR